MEESNWKVWEDEEIVDMFDRKVVKKEKVVEEEEVEEGMDVDKESGEESGKMEKVVDKGKGKEIEVVDISSGSEEKSGVRLIEVWKKEKMAREKREKDEKRKREVEGMVNRGRDRDMGRKEVMEMRQMVGDYEEVVGDISYVLGIGEQLASYFVMDREIRKVVEMIVEGDNEKRRDIRRMCEGGVKEEVEV